VIVVANILIEALAKAGKRSDEKVETDCIGVNKNLTAVRVRRETENVLNRGVWLVFIAHERLIQRNLLCVNSRETCGVAERRKISSRHEPGR
jgi:hypothetical protein